MGKTLTLGATPALIHDEHVLELVQSMDRLTGRWTEVVTALRGLTENGVLALETVKLDADGVASRDWNVPAAGIAVENVGYGDLTVSLDAGRRGSAPAFGPGVLRVPSGGFRCRPVATMGVTLYGQPGELVELLATTRALNPVSSDGARVVKAVPVAAGQLVTGAGTYAGFSLRETAGVGATVDLYDATTGAGTLLESIVLGASAGAGDEAGVRFANGIYAVITGAVQGSVRVS